MGKSMQQPEEQPVLIQLCPKHRRYLDWKSCTEGWEDKCSISLALDLKRRHEATKPKTITIPKDIQELEVSRQRKLQLAWKRAGKCQSCGDRLFDRTYCLYHRIMVRERQRKKDGAVRRYLGAASYKKEREIRGDENN